MIQLNFCRCASNDVLQCEAAGGVGICCASFNLSPSKFQLTVYCYEPVILHSTRDKSLTLGIKGLAVDVAVRLV